jgi:hypothetical protein
MIPMAILSIPFSNAIIYLSDITLSKNLSSNKIIILLCSLVFLVHFTAITLAYNAKLNEITLYQHTTQPFYRALQDLEYEERIAIVTNAPELILFGHGFWEIAPTELLDAFQKIILPISSLEEAEGYSDEIRYIGYFEDDGKAIVIPAQFGE